jgi:glycosyltransferase involved in cell wall biosynthesis
LIGYVRDDLVVPYYQNAIMFVLPSRFEPMGMTAQEAMACGLPVVASQYGGIRTVITDQVSGLLVDPADTDRFARAMTDLLDNENKRLSIGHEASRLIHEKYSWDVIARQHLDFYSGLY